MSNFKVGRNNFALTIFIPVDCDNNCPFCTSKKDYAEHRPDLFGIIKSLRELNKHRARFKDVVITGGEPFKNLELLDTVLLLVNRYIEYECMYVNTTLPSKDPETDQKVINFINSSTCIDGISISRHLAFDFPNVFTIDQIKHIAKNKRINCVLPCNINTVNNASGTDNLIAEFADRWLSVEGARINFRADYRSITKNTLHSQNYVYFGMFDKLFGYEGSSNCNVCHTDFYGKDWRVSLHRGLEITALKYANHTEVNDLIIKQDGEMCYDWNRDNKCTDEVLNSLFGEAHELDAYNHRLYNNYGCYSVEDTESRCGENYY